MEEEEGGGEDPFLCFEVDDLEDAAAALDESCWESAFGFCFLVFFGDDDDAVAEVALFLLRASGLEEDACADCVDAA